MADIKLTKSIDIVVCGDRGQYCSKKCHHLEVNREKFWELWCKEFCVYLDESLDDPDNIARCSKCDRTFENILRQALKKE